MPEFSEEYKREIEDGILSDRVKTFSQSLGEETPESSEAEIQRLLRVLTDRSTEVPKAEENIEKEDEGFFTPTVDFYKELPSQVAGGIYDSINTTVDTAKDVVKYLPGGESVLQKIEEKWGPEAKLLPVMPAPSGISGAIVRTMVNFASAFFPAGAGAKALGATGLTKSLSAGLVADTVAMDPRQERLSVFLNEVPVLKWLVPNYLADNNAENESLWENRFKNAVEGLGLGFMAESLYPIFKHYKVFQRAKAEETKLKPLTAEETLKNLEKGMEIKNKAQKELISGVSEDELTGIAKEISVGAKEGVSEDKVFINFARMDTPEEINKTLQLLADKQAEFFKKGKKTHEEIVASSEQNFKKLNTLVNRPITRPFTAEESFAAREFLVGSAENVSVLAKKVTDVAHATKVDMFNFERSLAIHSAIQQTVLWGRRATAQSLNAWRIPAGTNEMRSKTITEITHGRNSSILEKARMIDDLASKKTIDVVSRAADKAMDSRWSDSIFQLAVNGLLSKPIIHMINAGSNTISIGMGIPEKYMSVAYEKMLTGGGSGFVEANARLSGFLPGIVDGLKLFFGAVDDTAFRLSSKIEFRANGLTSTAWGKPPDSYIGKGFDYIGRGIGLPGFALEKADVFFKGINYRMMLHEKSAQEAFSEGLTGPAFRKRYTELIENPTDPIKNVSMDFARYMTFTSPAGPITRDIKSFIGKAHLRSVVPFIRTPSNVFYFAFERTPLAPLKSEIDSALKAGGSEKATALARMSAGSLLMLSSFFLAKNGLITGSGPQDYRNRRVLEQTGWQPYSFKMGDKYISYRRFDPYSSLLGLGAGFAEISDSLGEDAAEEFSVAIPTALFRFVGDHHFLFGLTDFIDVVTSGEPRKFERWTQRYTSMYFPYSGLSKEIGKYCDDVRRDRSPDSEMGFMRSLIENYKATFPGVGEDAPALRDLWGEERHYPGGLWLPDIMSPLQVKEVDPDPVNNLLADNKIPVSLPSRKINGVELTNEEYSLYSELAGKEAKKMLDIEYNRLKTLSPGKDGSMSIRVQQIIDNARKKARMQLFRQIPGFRERSISNEKQHQAALRGEDG